DGKAFRQEIDLPSLFLAKKTGIDMEVAGGDAIYVHRAPMYYIYGEVQRAGSYRLERDMTVLQGLALGGGLTPRGTERGVKIHRRGPDGKIEVINPKMDQALLPDDVIYIQESLF
ncbi:MAG: SLBB domain-containing protein, partial [Actinomycetota bacterium]